MIGTTTEGQALTYAEGQVALLETELGITEAQKAYRMPMLDAIKLAPHDDASAERCTPYQQRPLIGGFAGLTVEVGLF